MSIDVKAFIISIAAVIIVPFLIVGIEITDSNIEPNEVEIVYEAES